jgi:hypothetical protein
MYNCKMPKTRARRLIGILILLISLALLVWGLWPVETTVRDIIIPSGSLQLPTPQSLLPGFFALA